MSDKVVDSGEVLKGMDSPLVAEAYGHCRPEVKGNFALKVSKLQDETSVMVEVLERCVKNNVADDSSDIRSADRGAIKGSNGKGSTSIDLSRDKRKASGCVSLSKNEVIDEASAFRMPGLSQRLSTLLKHIGSVNVKVGKNGELSMIELVPNPGVYKGEKELEFKAKDKIVHQEDGAMVTPLGVQMDRSIFLEPKRYGKGIYFAVKGGSVVNHVVKELPLKNFEKDMQLEVSRMSILSDSQGRCVPLIGINKPFLVGGGIKYKFVPIDETGKRLNNEVVAKL